MRINKPTFEELEPNIPNRKKSVHSRGGGQQGHVRMRHPEHHKSYDEVPSTFPGDDFAEPPCDCPPATDTQEYPLDDFRRTVVTNTYSPGDPAMEFVEQYQASQIALHYAPYEVGPFTLGVSHTVLSCCSYKGSGYLPWTQRPEGHGCDSWDNYFNGWVEKEVWCKFLVTSKPGNVAGVILDTISGPTNQGVGPTYGSALRISWSEPGALREGSLLATIPNGGTTTNIFIPSNLIPPAGEHFWLGITPNWMADHDTTWGVCQFLPWPYVNGAGNSGGLGKMTWPFLYSTFTWQTWDLDADDFGSPNSGDSVGGNWGDLPAWQIQTDGGVAGIDGNSLHYTVDAGEQHTLIARLPGAASINPEDEDDLDYDEPWTDDLGVGIKVRFKLVTAGSTSETGERKFTFGWHDTRDLIRGTVYLGDMVHAQGLSLFSDDLESAFVAKDITEGDWHWIRIDTRHPRYTRMKMWHEEEGYGGNEPVAWDIQTTRPDDADRPTTDNYLEMTMTLGNETGDAQSLYVDTIYIMMAGEDNQWVVDYLGEGDGLTSRFYTAQPFKPGTLWPFVDGLHVNPNVIDAEDGAWQARQRWPAAHRARMLTRYIVDDLSDAE